ncbi:MAG: hypothetical protein H7Y37_08625 [Anaerolineae bacterium]|nr:hypothetical protein [Gloeobacterales cyanobacterium ES-bin-313]
MKCSVLARMRFQVADGLPAENSQFSLGHLGGIVENGVRVIVAEALNPLDLVDANQGTHVGNTRWYIHVIR